MTSRSLSLLLTIALLLPAACSSEPEQTAQPEAPAAATSAPAAVASTDPSGKWSGDWGPSERDRNNVTLDLQWNGSNLTGTINPGDSPVQLMNTSYNPSTGVLMMEADVSRRGTMVRYTIEGKVEGNMISGTWKHDKGSGDFKVAKS
jgi:hypothetical protein